MSSSFTAALDMKEIALRHLTQEKGLILLPFCDTCAEANSRQMSSKNQSSRSEVPLQSLHVELKETLVPI
jgi:hypothetical protein